MFESRSNYKKSYFWWFRNIAASGDSTGSSQIQKSRVHVLDYYLGTGEKLVNWFQTSVNIFFVAAQDFHAMETS